LRGRRKMKIFQVDSFTDEPFKGNPAGVCLLDRERPDSWLQSVAMEMNLSETAFLLESDTSFNLRWFTPKTEVSLCGHGTLASAHVLWEEGIVDGEAPAVFDTQSGRLICKLASQWIQMEFPARSVEPTAIPSGLVESLGLEGREVQVSKYEGSGESLYLVEVGSAKMLQSLAPDFARLTDEVRSPVAVTSGSESADFDFESRFFAPTLGIEEDPVTGSAHCYLAPYWSERLKRRALTGYQRSNRGGVVKCELRGGGVVIAGKAVTVLKGDLIEP
jgi:PhzF family phenazine biosynthesis protein